ncbi:hypothetical protein FFLO_06676 [Filobasidium floriforme]|uniref:FAD dependent oxidoreductase domain-containing protein n=1 Tax=Filobasidium floriforme TaxID=5210 RepID=A0A8K0JEE1_9TREE|nr:hypothetical protein FFLO_06676 [Filobasidium floriforme]
MATLNIDAIEMWKKPEWKGTFHESGVIVSSTEGHPSCGYVDSSYDNVKQLDPGVRRLEGKGFHSAYPDCLASSSGSTSSLVPDRLAHLAQRVTHSRKSHLADFPRRRGYVNPTSGWGEATRACEVVLEDIKRMGCKLVPGKEVTGMTFIEHESTRGGKRTVNGVKFSDGSEMKADLVVIAAGAWTPALFAQPMMGGLPAVVAAGQCVAKIQLTPEEAEEYRDIPVTLDLTTGFYCFPPNPDGIMKLAIHADGYVNTSNPPDPKSTNEGSAQSSGISAPRTILTPGAADGFIPKRQVQILRHELSKVFPRLAEEKDFVATRLCWYTDTPDSNWLIDWHPEMDGLLLATAGCGHAFKFLPNIGREILARIEGTLSPEFAHKWRFEGRAFADRDPSSDADIRGGGAGRKKLVPEELAERRDLRADAFTLKAAL